MTAAGPNFKRQPHGDGVERIGQRLRQRHRAEIFVLVVFRPPALHRDRRVLAHRVGRQPVFERGEIDERLERRAGLALGGDGAVELALGVAACRRPARAPRRPASWRRARLRRRRASRRSAPAPRPAHARRRSAVPDRSRSRTTMSWSKWPTRSSTASITQSAT